MNVVNIHDRSVYIPPPPPYENVKKLIGQVEAILWSSEQMSEEDKKAYDTALIGLSRFLANTRLSESLIHWDYQANLRKATPALFDAKGTLNELPYIGMIIALLAQQKKKSHLKRKVHLGQRESLIDEVIDRFIQISWESPNDAISIVTGKIRLSIAKKEYAIGEKPIDEIPKVA